MKQISVTLQICTLYHGLPHGIALIDYKDPEYEWESFRGLGVFNLGKLHNEPFTCVRGDGWRYSFSKMQNERPADGSYYTQFNRNVETQHLDSLKTNTNVSDC